MRRFHSLALLALAAPAGLICTQARPAQSGVRITGGPALSMPQQAPWSVLVVSSSGQCSGSIIDATHVLTAAHCTVGEDGRPEPASSFTVTAGIVQVGQGADTSQRQIVGAAAVAAYPGYQSTSRGDDIALLTVAPAFSFAGTAVAAIAVASSPPATGAAVVDYGWGQTSGGQSDGREHELDETVAPSYACLSGVPSLVCASSATGSVCPGDSGSGLVSASSAPMLVGVTDSSIYRPHGAPCTPGDFAAATDLSSPEIVSWLHSGSPSVAAPSTTRYAELDGTGALGSTLTCRAPSWSGTPTLAYVFVWDGSTQTTLQSGPSDAYIVRLADGGHDLSCVSVATNAGGITGSLAADSLAIPVPTAADFISEGRLVKRDGAYDVQLRVASPAIGAQATFVWAVAGCEGCAFRRTSTLTMTLRKNTYVPFPKLYAAHRAARLDIRVPAITIRGVVYRAGRQGFAFGT